MLTDQQKAAIQAASLVLEMAGVKPWFEARIIKDSTKKLNGRRISSLKRTDLASVLKIVEEKRVAMLPDMRMELRMYATVTSSRSPPAPCQAKASRQSEVQFPSQAGVHSSSCQWPSRTSGCRSTASSRA